MNAVTSDWLQRAEALVPASLHQRMRQALAAQPAEGSAAEHMAAAAVVCLEDAIALGEGRAAALPLLAADALMTAACELAAADGPDALQRLCAAYAPDRLAVLVPLS